MPFWGQLIPAEWSLSRIDTGMFHRNGPERNPAECQKIKLSTVIFYRLYHMSHVTTTSSYTRQQQQQDDDHDDQTPWWRQEWKERTGEGDK